MVKDAAPVLADLKSEDLDSEDIDNVKDVLAEYFRGVKKDQSDLNLRNWNLGRYKAKKAVENFQKGRGFFKIPVPFWTCTWHFKKNPRPLFTNFTFYPQNIILK